MKALKKEAVFWNVFFMAFLAIFIKFGEPGLGNSSTGYGALARNLSQDWRFFHLSLAPGFFDPFVDHPPLVIWLNAFLFKLMGASTQSIRLLSSFFALGIFASVFFTARRFFDEKVATLSCVALVTVNVFMNYTSSGWLDMSMVGLVWIGSYFALRGLKDERLSYQLIGGFFFGLAVLAKGVCALGIFPVSLFLFFHQIRRRQYLRPLIFTLIAILPIAAFTLAHYSIEGFLFWKQYLFREAVVATLDNPEPLTWRDYIWYLQRAFQYGHIVTILALGGCFHLWKKGRKDWALLLFGELIVHSLGYSWSTRHYSQYVIPIFPWLAIGAGYFFSIIFKNLKSESISVFGVRSLLVVFIAVEILPIRVHSGNENPYRGFVPTMRQLKDNRHMYFVGKMSDQETWEDPISYIVWFWARTPIMVSSIDEAFQKVNSEDTEALAVVSSALYQKNIDALARYPNVTACMHNDILTLISSPSLCPERVKTWRFREPAKGGFEKAP